MEYRRRRVSIDPPPSYGRGLSTASLRIVIGGKHWWEKVHVDWYRHADGLWRRRDRLAAVRTSARIEFRPLVLRVLASEWNFDRFLSMRRRLGKRDDDVATELDSWGDKSPDVIVMPFRPKAEDMECRREIFRVRHQARHAVIAIVPDSGAGKRTEEYLALCTGPKRTIVPTSKTEDRLAEAFGRRGIIFERQVPVGRFFLDFLIRGRNWDTAVEVDGRYWHTDEYGNRKPDDLWRDKVLTAVGIHTVRIWANEVYANPNGAVELALRIHEQPTPTEEGPE